MRHAQPSGGGRKHESRPSSPSADTDSDSLHRPSFSDATPRPTPSQPRPIAQDSSTLDAPASKRLAFFADKLSGTSSSQGHHHHQQSASTFSYRPSPVPSHPNGSLIPPRSHSRTDSAISSLSPMASSSSTTNASKVHISPSKSTTGRTYDSRLVSREMHRLGTLPHLPGLPASLSATASSSTLAIPATVSASSLPTSASERDNPWGSLHVHVLPLFNGEPLRVPIEDLNTLVKRHIQAVVSQSPSKALATLENDASELIASGMVTLNAKFIDIEENKLLARVVDMWGFFWDQVLPYVEGALLPLQTDALLASLHRNPKTHRSGSPTHQNSGSISMSSSLNISSMGSSSHPHIDVRTVGLRGFRDQIILPLFQRLYARLSMPNRLLENEGFVEPRCNQMMLVLAFQTREPSTPPSFSLAAPTPPAPKGPGEKALDDLIRALRLPHTEAEPGSAKSIKHTSSVVKPRAPSFLSAGLPRDRRGRIAHKRNLGGGLSISGGGDGGDNGEGWDEDGEETPRNGFVARSTLDMENEREREFLEGLRSPDPITSSAGVGARASVGGWGLGGEGGSEDPGKGAVEEDEYDGDDDEPLTWDEAQLMVENIMIYASKMTRLQEDHAGASAIRDVPGRLFEAYERKGFAKDRIEAEKQAKKDQAAVDKQTKKPDASASAATTAKAGRK